MELAIPGGDPATSSFMGTLRGGPAKSGASSSLRSRNEIFMGGGGHFGGSGGFSIGAAAVLAVAILGAVWLWKK